MLSTTPVSESAMKVVRVVAAFLLPPLGVLLRDGLHKRFWLNLLLTFFGYIPGVVHALWVVLKV
jgi:uncharacterized membrane protein YqaE (UPF0057 family)